MKILQCGVLGFQEARALQEELVQERKAGRVEDTLLVLEHPPTLSLGLRADPSDPLYAPELWRSRGVDLQINKRGGSATYHGPGQMILYPVLSLRERGIGVREFVKRGLEGIAASLVRLGIAADARLEPAGVWIKGSNRKLASVGLRIEQGVSNHGFSINISCDLTHFSLFPVCGESITRASTILSELGLQKEAMSADQWKSEEKRVGEEVLTHFCMQLDRI